MIIPLFVYVFGLIGYSMLYVIMDPIVDEFFNLSMAPTDDVVVLLQFLWDYSPLIYLIFSTMALLIWAQKQKYAGGP